MLRILTVLQRVWGLVSAFLEMRPWFHFQRHLFVSVLGDQNEACDSVDSCIRYQVNVVVAASTRSARVRLSVRCHKRVL